MFPLGLLGNGERAEIIEVKEFGQKTEVCGYDTNRNEQCRIVDMGIREGKIVEMLNNAGGSALLLKVDESRIAIGRCMAMKVMVRREAR